MSDRKYASLDLKGRKVNQQIMGQTIRKHITVSPSRCRNGNGKNMGR
jgi:hypothetical protein